MSRSKVEVPLLRGTVDWERKEEGLLEPRVQSTERGEKACNMLRVVVEGREYYDQGSLDG